VAGRLVCHHVFRTGPRVVVLVCVVVFVGVVVLISVVVLVGVVLLIDVVQLVGVTVLIDVVQLVGVTVLVGIVVLVGVVVLVGIAVLLGVVVLVGQAVLVGVIISSRISSPVNCLLVDRTVGTILDRTGLKVAGLMVVINPRVMARWVGSLKGRFHNLTTGGSLLMMLREG